MLIRVHTEADLRLHNKANRYISRKGRRKALLFSLAFFTGAAVATVLGFDFFGAENAFEAMVPGYLLLCAGMYLSQWSMIRKAVRKSGKNAALDPRPTQFVLTEERFGFERPGEEVSIAWTLIGDVREHHELWLIHRWDNSQIWYVPKIGMPEPDIEEFRSFLASRHELIAAMHPQAT